MNLTGPIVTGLSTIAGTGIGVYLTRLFMKGKPKILVSACELSSKLYSMVSRMEIPVRISELLSIFRWRTYEKDVYEIPHGTTLIPIGVAQGTLDFLEKWSQIAEKSIIKLEKISKRLKPGLSDEEIKEILQELFENVLIRLVIIGKARRKSYKIFELKQLDIDKKKPILPWVIDEAGGPGKGVLGAYSIDLGKFRITFPFKWEDEKEIMKIVSGAFAIGDIDILKSIIRDVLTEIKEDREIALEMIRWFEKNLDIKSSFIIQVEICNLGQLPFIVASNATLHIELPEYREKQIELISETYENTPISNHINRIVKHLKWIEEELESPVEFHDFVPAPYILVGAGEEKSITFRTITALENIEEGDTLLSLYRSGKLKARISITVLYSTGKSKRYYSSYFPFRTTLKGRK